MNSHWCWLTAGSAAGPDSARVTSLALPGRTRPSVARSPVSSNDSVGATAGNAGSPEPTMRSQCDRSAPSTSVTVALAAAGTPAWTS